MNQKNPILIRPRSFKSQLFSPRSTDPKTTKTSRQNKAGAILPQR